MITVLDTKQLYALFLESDWWVDLSRAKRRMAGKCERCGSKSRLQSHHRFYRDNWFDTRLDDLECLCCVCHEKEHGIVPRLVKIVPARRAPKPSSKKLKFQSLSDLNRARAGLHISREEFVELRDVFRAKRVKNQKARSQRSGKKRKALLAQISITARRKGRAEWIQKKERLGWSF